MRIFHRRCSNAQMFMSVGSYQTNFLSPVELSKAVCLHHPSFPSCSQICYWMSSRTWIRACTYNFEDDGLFSLKRLHSRTKTLPMLIRDLLYADNCVLVAHTLEDIQQITNAFARAAERLGLTISIKKTEDIYQSALRQFHSQIRWQILLPRKHSVKLINHWCRNSTKHSKSE